MTVFIKICGFRDASHVNAAADAAAISANTPSHIRRVAVMRHPADDEWQEVLKVFSPDVLQTDAEDFALLNVPDSVERWPVYRQGGVVPDAEGAYVFEGRKSGQGETVNWSHAATLAESGQMILAGGLAVHNVSEAIARVRPFGVDVSSGVESAPGQKDSQLINEFVRAARAAEKIL